MKLLDGKVAIVTGAAKGPKASLGFLFAQKLAEHGAKVALADISSCEESAGIIQDAGGEAFGMQTDVRDAQQVKALVDAAQERYGSVDILVNNACLGSNSAPTPLATITLEDFLKVQEVNLGGTLLCSQAVAPIMAQAGRGKIVNIGSTTADEGLPRRLAYVASKGAIAAMTRALARELGSANIQVNTLAPGFVSTQMSLEIMKQKPKIYEQVISARALPKDLVPDEMVGTLLYLCSHFSDAITGQCINVDRGGLFN